MRCLERVWVRWQNVLNMLTSMVLYLEAKEGKALQTTIQTYRREVKPIDSGDALGYQPWMAGFVSPLLFRKGEILVSYEELMKPIDEEWHVDKPAMMDNRDGCN